LLNRRLQQTVISVASLRSVRPLEGNSYSGFVDSKKPRETGAFSCCM